MSYSTKNRDVLPSQSLSMALTKLNLTQTDRRLSASLKILQQTQN